MERQQTTTSTAQQPQKQSLLVGRQVMPLSGPHRQMLQLQRSIGNRGVGRFIQAKLTIGAPGDKYEQEADHVAETVMRMPEPLINPRADQQEERRIQAKHVPEQITPLPQRKCATCIDVGAPCPKCAEEKKLQRAVREDEEETLQTKEASGQTPEVASNVAANIDAMRSGGQPLSASVRNFFEPRFGADFSEVRAHTDGRAAETSRAVNARAFTVGKDVAFGAGEYAPETSSGKNLLAHELTHVLQQNNVIPLFGHHAAGERLIQRKDGAEEQAQKDYAQLAAGGPYRLPNFNIGVNGKFDTEYQPAANLLNVNVKVKFVFPDDPPAGGVLGIINQTIDQTNYMLSYISHITKQWSKRYQFKNVREPQSIWGKLNPTDVHVNVMPVKAGQHFLIEARRKTAGTAQVSGGVMKLFKDHDIPQPAFNPQTRAGELKRADRINPGPILFANNSAVVPVAFMPKLKFFADYLKRINNPKFDLEIVGHASTSGKTASNQTLSEQRAKAVETALKGAGLTNHNFIVRGVGETGAAADAKSRKVDITPNIPAGWKNIQDVQAHEFGHMVGLGDEYGGATPNASHYDLVKKAFGQNYADQVAKRGDTDYASIMEGGDDVRIQHYVTFWSALCETTLRKTPAPNPKFGYDDWKFIG